MSKNTKLAIMLAVLMTAQPALADNDHNYVNYHSNKAPEFNPYDYDIAHMTEHERVVYGMQKREQKLARTNTAAIDRDTTRKQ